MADLDAADLDYVKSFHKLHYGPDNCVLTIVSDLESADVLARVEKYFGGIPARDEIPEVPDPVLRVPMGGPVRDSVTETVPAAGVFIGFRVPAYGERGHDAAQLASAVLGQGQGSRLYRSLVVDRPIAADDGGAGADILPFRYTDSLLLVNMLAREGVDGDILEKAIREEVAKLADGIADDELERARAVLERDHLHHISSPSGLADTIGSCTQLFDDPELAFTWPRRWADITAEEVRAAAERFLVDENMLVVRFDPEAEA